MKNVALIIARLSSSRLPKKNMMLIEGKPMIAHLIERIKNSKFIDEIVITTSDDISDDDLETFAKENRVSIFRGSLQDVMQRTIDAAKHFQATNIVEILGDNPLVHHELIDHVGELFIKTHSDYSATATKEYSFCDSVKLNLFSIGVRVQIYKSDIAYRYPEFKKSIKEDHHPSSFIFNNPEIFKLSFLEANGQWSFLNKPDVNFAVNYQKNFEFMKKVFSTLYASDHIFSLKEVIELINKDPRLLSLLGAEN